MALVLGVLMNWLIEFCGYRGIPLIGLAHIVTTISSVILRETLIVPWKDFGIVIWVGSLTPIPSLKGYVHISCSHTFAVIVKLYYYWFCKYWQCGDPSNVGDLEKQPFYKFIQKTYILHPIALGILLYAIGGFPFLIWGMV